MNDLFQFYGIDIVGTILIGMEYYYLGKKKKIGFIYGVLSCILWMIVAIYSHMWMLLAVNGFIIYAIYNAYTIWNEDKFTSQINIPLMIKLGTLIKTRK